MFSRTPCSSQPPSCPGRSRDADISPEIPAPWAPLCRAHKIPSNTRRLSIHGWPPRRSFGSLWSKGAIFCQCASVGGSRDRAIGPPSALLTVLIRHSQKLNHHHFRGWRTVIQQFLVNLDQVHVRAVGNRTTTRRCKCRGAFENYVLAVKADRSVRLSPVTQVSA